MRSVLHLTEPPPSRGTDSKAGQVRSIRSKSAITLRNRAWGIIVPPARNIWSTRTTIRRRAPWLSKSSPWDAPGFVRMNSFKAKLTNPIDINTIAGGHFRLMPGQYRVTPDRQGGAELVRIDAKQPTSPIRLTPVQWGILEAARFIERR